MDIYKILVQIFEPNFEDKSLNNKLVKEIEKEFRKQN
jgi:hypothetical protein